MKLSDLPPVGQPLDAGIFAGITTRPDGAHCAVVLLADKPAAKLAWQAAMTWAADLGAELPKRTVSALLFANASDQFDTHWHWTGDELDGSYAWGQGFYDGYQFYGGKSVQARARAVRLIQLTA